MKDYLQLFVDETNWYNQIVLGVVLPENLWKPLPHIVQAWLRNYIAGVLLYFISGGLWSFYIYYWKRNLYIPNDCVPSKEPILLQIMVSMKAMPLYCCLPTLSEYMIERGWTKCYSSIREVGWPAYVLYLAIYLVLVEFGIYWMHRELHDIKPLYKYLHATHHVYNKQNTLSPFAGLIFRQRPFDILGQKEGEMKVRGSKGSCCNLQVKYTIELRWLDPCVWASPFVWGFDPEDDKGGDCDTYFGVHRVFVNLPGQIVKGLAFHPIDGILQAIPHVFAYLLVPMHFWTHMLLLFCEGVWTANIHDCIHGKVWPIMGAGYHTIHHTTYRHNYGHYTIWMDWMFGTLRDPVRDEVKMA